MAEEYKHVNDPPPSHRRAFEYLTEFNVQRSNKHVAQKRSEGRPDGPKFITASATITNQKLLMDASRSTLHPWPSSPTLAIPPAARRCWSPQQLQGQSNGASADLMHAATCPTASAPSALLGLLVSSWSNAEFIYRIRV